MICFYSVGIIFSIFVLPFLVLVLFFKYNLFPFLYFFVISVRFVLFSVLTMNMSYVCNITTKICNVTCIMSSCAPYMGFIQMIGISDKEEKIVGTFDQTSEGCEDRSDKTLPYTFHCGYRTTKRFSDVRTYYALYTVSPSQNDSWYCTAGTVDVTSNTVHVHLTGYVC